MKKIKLIILIVITLLLIVAGVIFISSRNNNKSDNKETSTSNIQSNLIKKEEDTDSIVEIKEKYFMTQINDIYTNTTTYIGKKVSYEGFIYYTDANELVVARKYYCCGTDSYYIGIECIYDLDKPENNAWVKVTGEIIKAIDEDGIIYPKLKVTNLEKLDKRGEETVYN